eukprot:Pgem_evm1s14806
MVRRSKSPSRKKLLKASSMSRQKASASRSRIRLKPCKSSFKALIEFYKGIWTNPNNYDMVLNSGYSINQIKSNLFGNELNDLIKLNSVCMSVDSQGGKLEKWDNDFKRTKTWLSKDQFGREVAFKNLPPYINHAILEPTAKFQTRTYQKPYLVLICAKREKDKLVKAFGSNPDWYLMVNDNVISHIPQEADNNGTLSNI